MKVKPRLRKNRHHQWVCEAPGFPYTLRGVASTPKRAYREWWWQFQRRLTSGYLHTAWQADYVDTEDPE